MWNKLKNIFSSKFNIETNSEPLSKDLVDNKEMSPKEFIVTDESNHNDSSVTALSYAIKRTIDEFGTCVIEEDRFINIVKDYSGFRELPAAEIVVKTLVNTQSFSRIVKIKGKASHEIANILNLEISRSMNQYGFSEDVLKHVFMALAYGMGHNVRLLETSRFSTKEETPLDKTNSGSQQEASSAVFMPVECLDLRRIPFSMKYKDLRNKLCQEYSGKKLQDYDIEGSKTAFFSCSYDGMKNTEIGVFSDRRDNKTVQLTIFYANESSPITLKSAFKNVFRHLKKMYGKPAISYEGDLDAYLDYLNLWKENPIDQSFYYLNLQAFLLKEGSVICSLKYTPTEYMIILSLTPREEEKQDILSWRFQQPSAFQLIPPLSPEDNSFTEDDEDYSESENDYEVGIAIQVAQIIANMLGLDINTIGPNTDMCELCDWGLDYENLSEELYIEMGVNVDSDDMYSCNTLYELVNIVIWHLENE